MACFGKATISICIVNWNAGCQLADCIKSIEIHEKAYLSKVIVVDNASTDKSLDCLEQLCFPIQLIRSTENLGFASACNLGAALADGDYILFLNPDTRMFRNSISEPLAFMERPESADVGICGIQLLDESGEVAHSCARFPTPARVLADVLGLSKLPWFLGMGVYMSEWDHATSLVVDHVIGAFFLVRRKLFEELNGFDQRFFLYLEDVDFSIRAGRIGWRSVYLANAQAFHAGGGSSRQVKGARLFYSLQSRLLYGFKNFSQIKAWALLIIMLVVEPWNRLAFTLGKGLWSDTRYTLRGYRMLIHNLPAILRVAHSKAAIDRLARTGKNLRR